MNRIDLQYLNDLEDAHRPLDNFANKSNHSVILEEFHSFIGCLGQSHHLSVLQGVFIVVAKVEFGISLILMDGVDFVLILDHHLQIVIVDEVVVALLLHSIEHADLVASLDMICAKSSSNIISNKVFLEGASGERITCIISFWLILIMGVQLDQFGQFWHTIDLILGINVNVGGQGSAAWDVDDLERVFVYGMEPIEGSNNMRVVIVIDVGAYCWLEDEVGVDCLRDNEVGQTKS